MKILHIISSANPKNGGPVQGIKNYESALLKIININNNTILLKRTLLCLDNTDDVLKFGIPESINIVALGNSVSRWKYNKYLYSWLRNNITNYDKIIINGLWSYHSFCVYLVKKYFKKKNIPFPKYFVMPHGMLDPWFQKDKSRRLKALRNYIYWHLFEKKVINNADGLLFTCEDELKLAKKTFPDYRPKKEINISYGVAEPPLFSEFYLDSFYNKFNLKNGDKYFLYLSRIHPKKGLDILLEAYKKIILELSIDIPLLIIAGDYNENIYSKKLKNIVDNDPILFDKVKFVGQLYANEKWAAFYGCEAFILPSHQENFGIAVIEALACSKPVLITNKINIYHDIQKYKAGIIDNDSIDGVYNSIKIFLNLSNVDKIEMGQNAFLLYKNNYDVNITSINFIKAILN